MCVALYVNICIYLCVQVHVCVWMYLGMLVYIHVYKHMYMCKFIYAYMYTFMCTGTYICVDAYVHVWKHSYIQVHACEAYLCVHVYVYRCMYVYVCIYVYRHMYACMYVEIRGHCWVLFVRNHTPYCFSLKNRFYLCICLFIVGECAHDMYVEAREWFCRVGSFLPLKIRLKLLSVHSKCLCWLSHLTGPHLCLFVCLEAGCLTGTWAHQLDLKFTTLSVSTSLGLQVHSTMPWLFIWTLRTELRASCLCSMHFVN